MRAILVLIIISSIALFSLFLAHFTVNSDFPVYYNAAKTILDQRSHSSAVYVLVTSNKFSIPETVESFAFIYSIAAAYLVAPLALLPYYTAKTMMIFINFMAYLGAITIIMRINGASGRFFFYPLVLSLLWLPFLQDLRSGQINALLLFLVSIAVFSAIQKRPGLSGIFFGIASLFKLFPIAIAMVLGLRNWRILAICTLIVSATFLIPGSLDWFSAMGNIHKNYSPIYLCLTRYGIVWFYLYVITVAGITALVSYQCKDENYAILVSLAIPAVLMIMPIMEYYHSTLLMFSFTYLVTSDNKTDRILMATIAVSVLLISFSFFFTGSSIYFGSRLYLSNTLLLLGFSVIWASLAWRIHRTTRQTY